MNDTFNFSRNAYVTAVATNAGTFAFAFGDGAVALLSAPDNKPNVRSVSAGIIHTLAPQSEGFLLGDEYGQLNRIIREGEITAIHQFPHEWIEHIIFNQRLNLSAIVAGKTLALWDGKHLLQLSDHPSTISGIAFAAKGNRIAAAHYNGVTQWAPTSTKPISKHVWKGSHISITWSPDMKYIITGTQERELHVFILANNDHLFMSGYLAKVRSFSWNAKGNTLYTSGSTRVLGWNFSGKGPAGKAPLTLGYDMNALVTCVACHPKLEILAVGYDNGVILIIDIKTNDYVQLFRKDGDIVTCCAWDMPGNYLIYGTKQGNYGIVKV